MGKREWEGLIPLSFKISDPPNRIWKITCFFKGIFKKKSIKNLKIRPLRLRTFSILNMYNVYDYVRISSPISFFLLCNPLIHLECSYKWDRKTPCLWPELISTSTTFIVHIHSCRGGYVFPKTGPNWPFPNRKRFGSFTSNMRKHKKNLTYWKQAYLRSSPISKDLLRYFLIMWKKLQQKNLNLFDPTPFPLKFRTWEYIKNLNWRSEVASSVSHNWGQMQKIAVEKIWEK